MLKLSKKYGIIHYLFVLLILQVTCVPFWTEYRIALALLVIIAFFFYYEKMKGIKIDNKLILIFLIYLFIAVIQGIMWSFSLISFLSSFAFTVLLVYLVYKTYGFDFLFLFEQVFRILTVISMVIWGAQNLFPDVQDSIISLIQILDKYSTDEWPRSMLIYTYWDSLSVTSYIFSRNAGFLHEPGAFATLIILALVINNVKGVAVFNKSNLIYIAALISTVSTAGYLSLAVLFLLLARQKNQRVLSIFFLFILLALTIYGYNEFPFMKDKIEKQVIEETSMSLNEGGPGRIFGARKSLVVLLKYPLFGRGLNSVSQPAYDSPEFAGYGWISFVSKFGLVFGLMFMFYFLKGLYRFVNMGDSGFYDFIIISISVFINLSAQSYINKPFFLIFFFMGIYLSGKFFIDDSLISIGDERKISETY